MLGVLTNPLISKPFWDQVAIQSDGRIHVTEIRVGVRWADVDIQYRTRSAVLETPIRRTIKTDWNFCVANPVEAAKRFTAHADLFGPGTL